MSSQLEKEKGSPVVVEDWEKLAKEVLSKGAYDYVSSGSGGEETLAKNVEEFKKWELVPRVLVNVEKRDLSIELLNKKLAAPILLAPVGFQTVVHPDGELASARAATSKTLPFITSTVSSYSLEEISGVMGNTPRYFQLYWPNDDDIAGSLVNRAESAGYDAIVVTVDTPLLGWREKDLQNKYFPMMSGAGIANFVSDPVFQRKYNPNGTLKQDDLIGEIRKILFKQNLTWEKITWLRKQTSLPILLKGIMHKDDALQAIAHEVQIQGAPNIYVCYEGALDKVKEIVEKEQLQHGLFIHGTKSWDVAKKYVEPLHLQGKMVHYNKECTKGEVRRLIEISTVEGCDYIVGIGGGKIMDIVKAVAHQLQLPYILIPTLASNCAPWTPLSVFYDEAGNFVNYEVFLRNALLVAVEPKIIMDSPEDYLRAGIGDTIAKWYEADVLVRNLQERPLSIDIALHAAKLCRDVLIEEGHSAVDAWKKKTVTASFIRVVETIIMAGGMVGGFGERYGRIAGAHSIHNGLTTIEATHDHLHGDKVAYGILVQLALEEDYTEIKELLPYYEKLKLPTTLADVGITEKVEEAIKKIAEGTTKEGESIHLMNVSSPNQVEEAMKELERIVAGQRQK